MNGQEWLLLITGWWFGTFLIFDNHPNWLSYFSEGWPWPTNQIKTTRDRFVIPLKFTRTLGVYARCVIVRMVQAFHWEVPSGATSVDGRTRAWGAPQVPHNSWALHFYRIKSLLNLNPQEIPKNSHEIPMKSPWNPYEITMKSLWHLKSSCFFSRETVPAVQVGTLQELKDWDFSNIIAEAQERWRDKPLMEISWRYRWIDRWMDGWMDG